MAFSASTYAIDLDALDRRDNNLINGGGRLRNRLFTRKFSIALTAANVAVGEVGSLLLFPADCHLVALAGHITDVDTNATPTHEMKLTVGANDVTTGITAGQAGGRLLTDAQMSDWYFLAGLASATAANVSGLALTMTSTTGAATAAAGTLTLWLSYIRGLETFS